MPSQSLEATDSGAKGPMGTQSAQNAAALRADSFKVTRQRKLRTLSPGATSKAHSRLEYDEADADVHVSGYQLSIVYTLRHALSRR
jgi:hypothetical protein